jgi:hypothetical protein
VRRVDTSIRSGLCGVDESPFELYLSLLTYISRFTAYSNPIITKYIIYPGKLILLC